MANDLTTRGNTAVGTAGFNPFLDAAQDMGVNTSGALFLKFSGNTGVYTYGKDADILEIGTEHALNADAIKRGWICWNDGKVVDELMTRVSEGRPVAKHELEDHGPYVNENDGWSEQSSIEFRDIETGKEFLYKTSSKSGIRAVGGLISAYGKVFQQRPGELAIITLGADSFVPKNAPKSAGKKYAPNLKITGWVDEEELVAKFANAVGDNEDDYEDEAEEPVVEPVKAPEAGSGRKSRRF